VGFVGDEIGYCSETCVMGGVGGTGEGSVEVEDPIDIKEEVGINDEEDMDINEEIPEPIVFPPIKTENEVRFWGVLVDGSQLFKANYLPQKRSCGIEVNHFPPCVILFVQYSCCTVDCNPERKRRLVVIAVSGKIVLQYSRLQCSWYRVKGKAMWIM
jgi:hypothetical protein